MPDWVIRTLTPSQRSQRDSIVATWLQSRPAPTRYQLAGLRGAATYRVLYGNPPNRWQRLGYRTAKRRRAWAELFPGIPYPGRGRNKS